MKEPHHSEDLSSMLNDQEREFTIMDYNLKKIKFFKEDDQGPEEQRNIAAAVIQTRKKCFQKTKLRKQEIEGKKLDLLNLREKINQEYLQYKKNYTVLQQKLIEKRKKIFKLQKTEIENYKQQNNNNLKYGSIENNDIVQEVIGIAYFDLFNKDQENPHFYVRWKERPDGVIPEKTYVQRQILLDYFPEQLLDAYIKKFYFDCDQK